jgi:hypothetical protein
MGGSCFAATRVVQIRCPGRHGESAAGKGLPFESLDFDSHLGEIAGGDRGRHG